MITAHKQSLPIILGSAIWLGMLIFAAPVHASSATAFYEGKTINVVVGYPAGGGFDAAARLLIRHMPKHMPGRPNMIAVNMPGAASLIAANALYNTAPKDGTTIGIIGGSVPFSLLWDRKGIRFDPARFNWLGSLDRWNGIALVWHNAAAQTYEQVLQTQILVGSTGVGDVTYIYPRILNALLGTKFKVVLGYQGTHDLNLAMEQGEIDGRLGWCWACMKRDKPDWVTHKKTSVLLQLGLKSDPELKNVPVAIRLAKTDEDRQIMRMVFASQEMARPFLTPPGIPAERLAALRRAFNETVKDPAFLADASKLKIPIDITSGQEIEQLMKEVYSTPKSVIERATSIMHKN